MSLLQSKFNKCTLQYQFDIIGKQQQTQGMALPVGPNITWPILEYTV